MTAREEALAAFYNDRWAAHQFFFAHRHTDESPPAHAEIVDRIHSNDPRYSFEGFRGLGKTTLLEEGVILKAAFNEFRYCVIVSANYRPLAIQRIASIKHEIETNERLADVFGSLRGSSVWQEGMIVLANGVCIQAIGRDMSVTGLKYLEARPNALMIDDVEDPDEVRTDLERLATWSWVQKTLLPSLDDPLNSWARALGTRRGVGSLPERLEKNGWPFLKVPIEYRDLETGERKAAWPARRSLAWIDKTRHDYRGDMHTFMQEYMCEPVSEQDRIFGVIPVRPRERLWEAVYAMIDPARTTRASSATTGYAVWSWVNNRLVVWEGGGERWLPDRIIAYIFELNERFGPVWIGVEEDGLNEFILQPLRHEQTRRGITVPVKPMRAPRGKFDFIRGLQPFAMAGEIEFARELPDLQAQLSSFPTGDIDGPNALAYAQALRPAAPIYDGFAREHIRDAILVDRGRSAWLAVNATRTLTTVVVFQSAPARLRILMDAALEGDPGETVDWLIREIGLELRVNLQVSAPPQHFDRYQNVGLIQAFGRHMIQVEQGTALDIGREHLRAELGKMTRSEPSVLIATRAKHTLNAFAGGHSRMMTRQGVLTQDAEPGLYRTLMEGLESCVGSMAMLQQGDRDGNWATADDGRRYLKYSRPARA